MKEDSNVWEAKDLRISKQNVGNRATEIALAVFNKAGKWDKAEEKLANDIFNYIVTTEKKDELLAWIYKTKGDKVNKMIEEHESKQQPF